MPTILYVMANARSRIMARLPVNIAMILGHQDLTLGEVEVTLQWRKIAICQSVSVTGDLPKDVRKVEFKPLHSYAFPTLIDIPAEGSPRWGC
jgi:hypothetical protein